MSNFLDILSSYLLDTNIISELVKPKPNEKVIKWLREKDQQLWVSKKGLIESVFQNL